MLFFSNFKFCSVKKKTWQYQMTEKWQTTEKQNWTATEVSRVQFIDLVNLKKSSNSASSIKRV